MSRFGPAADTQRTLTILMVAGNCSSGSGITATGTSIDVIGTR